MSFFHKKKCQNVWATIMPFGPMTNFLLAQKFFFGHCIHAEVYLIQCYVIKFVSDLRQAGGILQIF